MQSLKEQLFGPLPAQACDWFYVIMVLSLVFTMGGVLMALIAKFAMKVPNVSVGSIGIIALNGLMTYFVNRLMYTMCIQALGGVHRHA